MRTPFPLAVVAALAVLGACAPDAPPPPESRVDTVVDTFFGIEFADDYRWLEDQEADETRAWIAAQNEYSERIIGESDLRRHFAERIRASIDQDDVGSVRRAGDYEYFTMRRAGEELARVYRRPLGGEEDPTVEEAYEVILDPADLDPGHRTLVSIMGFDESGRLMMYSIRQGGADEIAVRIRDLDAGIDLPDGLPDGLWGGVRFDDAGTGFYYTRRSRYEGPRIMHHVFGRDPSADDLLWGTEYGPTAFINMDIVEDGALTIFTAQHGWASNDIFVREGDGPIRPLVEGIQAHFQHRYRDGTIYLRTDWNASNYRLMAVDPRRLGVEDWIEVIPEGEHVLDSYRFIDDEIYVTYLVDVAQQIEVFDAEGNHLRSIRGPENATVSVASSDEGGLRLTSGSYLQPTATWSLAEDGTMELVEPPEIEVDSARFTVTKLRVRSGHGIDVPLHVMHRTDLELDGSNPTILSGYGGFNSSTRPGFSNTRWAWIEAGGVWAVATLRGGSEYGEAWHRDGMLTNKQHVFDDFIAAAETLIDEGYTSPDRLGISGGSNGGLLVASAMTQRPELFRAVLCTYPDLDMVRFWDFQETNNMPALLEYGDARVREHFEAIRQYSPYQAVRDGVDYPSVMLTTGDLDTRVPPLQARKMAARLQAATGSGRPVILRYDDRGGHAAGRGRPISLVIEDAAAELAFMGQELGLEIDVPE